MATDSDASDMKMKKLIAIGAGLFLLSFWATQWANCGKALAESGRANYRLEQERAMPLNIY
jgi:hypothetical protein